MLILFVEFLLNFVLPYEIPPGLDPHIEAYNKTQLSEHNELRTVTYPIYKRPGSGERKETNKKWYIGPNLLNVSECQEKFAIRTPLNVANIPDDLKSTQTTACRCHSYRVILSTYKNFLGIKSFRIISENLQVFKFTQSELERACISDEPVLTKLTSGDYHWLSTTIVHTDIVKCMELNVPWPSLFQSQLYLKAKLLPTLNTIDIILTHHETSLKSISVIDSSNYRNESIEFYNHKSDYDGAVMITGASYDFILGTCLLEKYTLLIGSKNLYLSHGNNTTVFELMKNLDKCKISDVLLENSVEGVLDFDEIESSIEDFERCSVARSLSCHAAIVKKYSEENKLISRDGTKLAEFVVLGDPDVVLLQFNSTSEHWCQPEVIYATGQPGHMYVKQILRLSNLKLPTAYSSHKLIHIPQLSTQDTNSTSIIDQLGSAEVKVTSWFRALLGWTGKLLSDARTAWGLFLIISGLTILIIIWRKCLKVRERDRDRIPFIGFHKPSNSKERLARPSR